MEEMDRIIKTYQDTCDVLSKTIIIKDKLIKDLQSETKNIRITPNVEKMILEAFNKGVTVYGVNSCSDGKVAMLDGLDVDIIKPIDPKPKITIDCDLDKLAISIKGAMDTGNIRITDEKPTVIERLETIVKEFNYSVTLEANGDITIYRKKPTPPQPIIIKSGDTWVAELEGIDYLYIGSRASYCIKNFTAPSFFKELGNDEWVDISKIDITDEIAKLRPMVINASLKRPLILYAVNRVGMFICEKGVEKHLLNLATVKDLQE